MTALLNRIHARVGDLWWYSAMIFIACRSGDVINSFIGLWLVPKYVDGFKFREFPFGNFTIDERGRELI